MESHPTTERKLSFPTMTAYGVGQIGERLRLAGFSFLLFYYQQVVGLSGTMTASAIFIASLFDAFSDPIMGALSDRTKTRWGRRHPFMVIGMIPLAIGFVAVFNPPKLSPAGTFCWLLGSVFVSRVGTSMYHVAHMALGAEMARDYTQRATLFSFNAFFEAIAYTAGTSLTLSLFFPTTEKFNPGLLNSAGYRGFSLMFAVAMVAAISLSAWGTRREIKFLPEARVEHRFSFKQVFVDMRSVFANGSFRALFFGMLLGSLALGVEVALQSYMGTHFFRFKTEQLAIVPVVTFVGLFVAMPLVPIVARRFDKKTILLVTTFGGVFALHILILLQLLGVAWLPAPGSRELFRLYMGCVFVAGILGPIGFSISMSMFADIADEDELEHGERREGVIYAARAFTIAIIQTFSTMITGLLLDLIQFPKAARVGAVPDAVLWKLGTIPLAAAVVAVFGVLLYSGYRLDRKRHAEIAAALRVRRAQRTATPTEPRSLGGSGTQELALDSE